MKANSENMPVNTVNEKQLKDVKIICFPLFKYSNGSSSFSFQSMKVKTLIFLINKFFEKLILLLHFDTRTSYVVSGGKKYLFFGKFCVGTK